MTTPWAIEAEGLGRAYDEAWAVRNIDLQIPLGQRVLVLGANGSGKSTLLRLLATLLRPSTGSLSILGLNSEQRANDIRRRIGLMAHRPLLYENLSARENLRFYSRMYEFAADPEPRIDALLRLVGLDNRETVRVRALSRGQQQRLALARALLHDPTLLLLDEPDTGLDEEGLSLLMSVISEGDRTIVMATHEADRGLAWADRVLVLRAGRLSDDRLLRPNEVRDQSRASEART